MSCKSVAPIFKSEPKQKVAAPVVTQTYKQKELLKRKNLRHLQHCLSAQSVYIQ